MRPVSSSTWMRLVGHGTGHSYTSFPPWVTISTRGMVELLLENIISKLHPPCLFSFLGCELPLPYYLIFYFPQISEYRLPFDISSIHPLPPLPTEIWECIIDQIGYGLEHRVETETVYACTLVCRSWHIRARLHLYRGFSIPGDHIPMLQTTLKSNSSLSLPSTEVIRVQCGTKPVSALFLEPTLRNLTVL